MRFPMSIDGWVRGVSVFVAVLLGVMIPAIAAVVLAPAVPRGISALTLGVLGVVVLLLIGGAADAPTAVTLSGDELRIERRALPDRVVAREAISSVTRGPPLKLVGDVRRVAGNGGLLGFTGLYAVKGVGRVTCYATRLDHPTVIISRRGQRPLLVSPDDTAGFLAAARRWLGPVS